MVAAICKPADMRLLVHKSTQSVAVKKQTRTVLHGNVILDDSLQKCDCDFQRRYVVGSAHETAKKGDLASLLIGHVPLIVLRFCCDRATIFLRARSHCHRRHHC